MSWASNFVRFGSAIFVLPLILKFFTPIEQSFWFFINTILGFAMLADSGFGPTLIRAVSYFNSGADYMPRNKKEYDLLDKIADEEPNLTMLKNLLTTANRIYIYLGAFAVIMLSTGGLAATWNILKLSGHQIDIWIAFVIVIPYCYFMILSVKWTSFMRGLGYIAAEARFGVFQGVIRIIIFVILLLFHLGPAYLVGYMLLEAIIKYFYIQWFVLRWFKSKKVELDNRTFFDKQIFASLWSATWRTGLLFWGAYGIQSGTSILASQIEDAVLMANFLLTMRIISFVLGIARAPFYTNVPKIYQLAAKKDMPNLSRKSSGYMFLGFCVMIFAIVFIILFGNPSLELLGIETRFVPLFMLLIIAITELLDLHASFHATIYTSTNHVPFVLPATISGALLLLIGFKILPTYGLLGIVIAKFIIQFLFNNWYSPYLSLKLMKWPIHKYIYQFPLYGLLYTEEIIKTNIFRRGKMV
jgi:hypothetical protein